jgi:hypothetical protein
VTRAQLSDVGTILAHARLSATAETGHFSSIDPVADVVTRLSRVSLNNPPIKGHPCSVRFFFFFFLVFVQRRGYWIIYYLWFCTLVRGIDWNLYWHCCRFSIPIFVVYSFKVITNSKGNQESDELIRFILCL